jgi:hypothetical protein
MSNARDVLARIVDAEGARVVRSWRYADKRTAILELCRAIDAIYLETEEDSELAEACRQGSSKAILLFVDQSFNEQRTGLFPSNDETFQWALSALTYCARLATCEKILDYEKAGLCHLDQSDHTMRVEFLPKYGGIEALEVAEFDRTRGMLVDIQQPFHELLDSDNERITKLVRTLVYRWSDHFIGYGAHPEVDEHFHQRGLLRVQLMTGQDAFRDDSNFGGLPFTFYTKVVWTMVGWALKHIEFAKTLSECESDLLMQNLITVTADVNRISASIASALGCTEEEANQALALLEMNLDNARESSINGHAPPPLIRTSREQFLRPLAGLLQTPFEFMLRGMKRAYRSDWDRAVGEREGLFREELFKLFPQAWLIKIPTGITLRHARMVLTDIDAVILDLRNGVAGIFQLKWQDTFGHSMRERWARMRNFQREATEWLEAVHTFLSCSSPEDIRKVFTVPLRDWRPLKFCFFVIGRNFAHFSGETLPDSRAAWGVWPQVLRLSRESKNSSDPISTLHSELVLSSPMNKKVRVEKTTFGLGELILTMEPIG